MKEGEAVEIPIEIKVKLQIFESLELPLLSASEITSKLIYLSYQYNSYRQVFLNEQASQLEGRYLADHSDFMEKAPRIPEGDARKLLIQMMYLVESSKVIADYYGK